jgi:hypothetical protein
MSKVGMDTHCYCCAPQNTMAGTVFDGRPSPGKTEHLAKEKVAWDVELMKKYKRVGALVNSNKKSNAQ